MSINVTLPNGPTVAIPQVRVQDLVIKDQEDKDYNASYYEDHKEQMKKSIVQTNKARRQRRREGVRSGKDFLVSIHSILASEGKLTPELYELLVQVDNCINNLR